MITTILGFFSKIFSFFTSITDYFKKKNEENLIKNSYEKDKEIDALKTTRQTEELINVSNKKIEEIQNTMNNYESTNIKDANLTKTQINEELATIKNSKEKEDRVKQINIAKDIKKQTEKLQETIENDKNFKAGNEFIFKG